MRQSGIRWMALQSGNGSEDAKYYELARFTGMRKFLSTVKNREKKTKYNLGRLSHAGGNLHVLMCARFYSDSRHGEWQTSDFLHNHGGAGAGKFRRRLSFKEAGSGPGSRCVGNRMRLAISTAIPMESYVTNNWQQIGGVWYFFDENAYCKTNTWVFLEWKNGIIWM